MTPAVDTDTSQDARVPIWSRVAQTTKQRLKIYGVMQHETLQAVIERALEEFLERNNVPFPEPDTQAGSTRPRSKD